MESKSIFFYLNIFWQTLFVRPAASAQKYFMLLIFMDMDPQKC